MGAFAGAYALLKNTHVSVDIVSSRLPPRVQTIINIITFFFFFIFVGCLIWFGAKEAWSSFMSNEHEISTFASPLYPIKTMIPIGATLMFLQGIAKFIREIEKLKEKR
jgi:TRAP-type mannitol/chloroaromatic compound transport system permease small subunit